MMHKGDRPFDIRRCEFVLDRNNQSYYVDRDKIIDKIGNGALKLEDLSSQYNAFLSYHKTQNKYKLDFVGYVFTRGVDNDE